MAHSTPIRRAEVFDAIMGLTEHAITSADSTGSSLTELALALQDAMAEALAIHRSRTGAAGGHPAFAFDLLKDPRFVRVAAACLAVHLARRFARRVVPAFCVATIVVGSARRLAEGNGLSATRSFLTTSAVRWHHATNEGLYFYHRLFVSRLLKWFVRNTLGRTSAGIRFALGTILRFVFSPLAGLLMTGMADDAAPLVKPQETMDEPTPLSIELDRLLFPAVEIPTHTTTTSGSIGGVRVTDFAGSIALHIVQLSVIESLGQLALQQMKWASLYTAAIRGQLQSDSESDVESDSGSEEFNGAGDAPKRGWLPPFLRRAWRKRRRQVLRILKGQLLSTTLALGHGATMTGVRIVGAILGAAVAVRIGKFMLSRSTSSTVPLSVDIAASAKVFSHGFAFAHAAFSSAAATEEKVAAGGGRVVNQLLSRLALGAFYGQHVAAILVKPASLRLWDLLIGPKIARVLNWLLPTAVGRGGGARRSRSGARSSEPGEGASGRDHDTEGAERRESTASPPPKHTTPDEDWGNMDDRQTVAADADYYAVLGVEDTATPQEIKKAFHKRALALHPDRHQHDDDASKQEATVLFKAVNTAHEVLSDPRKKHQYDTFRKHPALRRWAKENGGSFGGGMSADVYGEYSQMIRAKMASTVLNFTQGAPRVLQLGAATMVAGGVAMLGFVAADAQVEMWFHRWTDPHYDWDQFGLK